MRTILLVLLVTLVIMANPVNSNRLRIGGPVKGSEDIQQDHPLLRLAHADVPMYPQMAREARLSGVVEAQVTVVEGAVSDVQVTSGAGILAQTTEGNIKSWRFTQPINTTFTTRFIYQLDKRKPSYGQGPRVELELPFKATITSAPSLGN